MGVDLEKAVAVLIKVAELLELGGFGELAVKAIRPAWQNMMSINVKKNTIRKTNHGSHS